MEERKLIRLGNSSFAIALPKNWITKSGLKKGDKVFIVPNSNGEIIISPEFKRANEEKEIFLDLKDKEETALQIALISSYLQDYNLFKIKNNLQDKQKKHIKELVKNLMSFEIIEENKEEIKLKDVFNLSEANIEGFVRRIDNIIRSFFEDILIAIQKGKINKEVSNEIQLADKEITKLYLLIGRIFMKSLNNPSFLSSLKIDSMKLFHYWWTALHIERIGDDLKFIARILERQIKSNIKELFGLLEQINQNYISTLTYYFQQKEELVKNTIEVNKKIILDIEKINQKEIGVAQIAERMKSLQVNIFQISKMISYVG